MVEEVKDETFTPGEVKKYIPVKAKSDAFDFESNTGQRKKVQNDDPSSSDDERVPLYLAIVLIDPKLRI